MTRRDRAVRARALAEAAARLLYLATLEAIGAVGHVDITTQDLSALRQHAEELLPRLDRLIQVTPS